MIFTEAFLQHALRTMYSVEETEAVFAAGLGATELRRLLRSTQSGVKTRASAVEPVETMRRS